MEDKTPPRHVKKRLSKRFAQQKKTKAPDMAKWVYTFGDGAAEGAADMRNLLGGKGANLAEMANLGLPVPPGFTISTEICTYFFANKKSFPKELEAKVKDAIATGAPLT